MAKLIYEDPELGEQVVVEFGPELPEVTVGRNPGNIIRINNPSISRRHTRFEYANGQCTLTDLGSANGTYVNGVQIQTQVLVDGDRIRVGEFPLDFAQRMVASEPVASMPPRGNVMSGGYDVPSNFANFGASAENFGSPASQASQVPEWGPEPGWGAPQADEAVDFDAAELILEEDDVQDIEAEPYLPEIEVAPVQFGRAPTGSINSLGSAASQAGNRSSGMFGKAQAQQADVESSMLALHEVDSEENEFVRSLGDGWSQGGAPGGASMGAPQDHAKQQRELRMLQAQVEQLEADNQNLTQSLEQLESAGGGGGGNAQVDRMRKERDRLADERRNLMRQLTEVRQQLEEAPTAEMVQGLESELAELKQELADRSKEIGDLKSTVAEQSGANEQLEESFARVSDELAQIRASFEQTEEERQSVDYQRSMLGEQVGDLQQTLQEYQDKQDELQATIESLEGQLETERAEVSSLGQVLAQREESLIASETSIVQRDREIAARDEEIEALNANISALNSELASTQERAEALDAELATRPHLDEVDDMVASLSQFKADLEGVTGHRDQLQSERDELESQLVQTRQVLNDLQLRYDKVGGERDELRRERDGLKQEKAAFARETDYLQVDRRRAADQITELTAKVDSFMQDRKRKKQIFDELSRDLRGLVEENTRHNETIQQLESALEGAPRAERVQELEDHIAGLQEELELSLGQLGEVEGEFSQLTRNLGQIADERDQLVEQLAEMTEELENLRAVANDEIIQETIASLETTRQELAENAAEIEALRAERDELLERKNELEEKSARFEEDYDALQSSAEQAQGSLDDLTSERDLLLEQLAELEEKLSSGADAIDAAERLKADKAALEATLADLILENDRLEDELRKK